MEIFGSVYRYIVDLGGLTDEKGDGRPNAAAIVPLDHAADSPARRWCLDEFARIREDLSMLAATIDAASNPTIADTQFAECRERLAALQQRVAATPATDQSVIGDVVSEEQITMYRTILERIEAAVKAGSVAGCSDVAAADDVVGVAEVPLRDEIYRPRYIYADILIALAQIDGKVEDGERELLNGIFEKMELDAGVVDRMWRAPRSLDVIEAILGSVTDLTFKCCLLKDCYLVAYADSNIAAEEKKFIKHICSVIRLGCHLETAIHNWSKMAIEQNRLAEKLFGMDLSPEQPG